MCRRIYVMASYAFWLCPVELDISACNVSTIGNDTTKKISIGNAPIGIAPIGIAPITNVTTKKISIDIATIRNDTITNATIDIENFSIGNDTIGIAPIRNDTITNATFGIAPIMNAPITNVTTKNFSIANATIMNVTTKNFSIGIAPIGNATITNATIGIATIRNDTITNATIGNDTNSYTTRNMSLASANKNRSNIYLPDIASPSSIYKNESMTDYSQENNVEQTYYRVLHVLWLLPIFSITLFYVSRKKSVRINANWKGRRVQRCQSWPVCRSNKKCIRSRSKSVPIDVSVFDGINNLAEKQNAADL